MTDILTSVRQFADERLDDDLREKLTRNYETAKTRVTKRDDKGNLVIAMEPAMLLQVIGGITLAWCALRLLGWVAPALWKLRWVLLIAGIAFGIWQLTKNDE
jgi:hypothetical protein